MKPAQADTLPFTGFSASVSTGVGLGLTYIRAERGDFRFSLPLGDLGGSVYSVSLGYTVPIERWRLGVAVSGSLASLSGRYRFGSPELGFTTGLDIDRLATARVELGYVPHEQWYVYGFAGRALARGTVSGEILTPFGKVGASRDGYSFGTVAGLGIEYQFNSNFSLFGEAAHYSYAGDRQVCWQQYCQRFDIEAESDTIVLGVRVRF